MFETKDAGCSVYGFILNGSYFISGELAQELGGSQQSPVETDGPTFYEVKKAFAWKLAAYYWLLCRLRQVEISHLTEFLARGHGEGLPELVHGQLDLLTRKFYELSEASSDEELRDLKRQFLGWFYTNLVYNYPDSDGKQCASSD